MAVGLFIWFTPAPEGLSTQAWHLFAIFVSLIIGIVAKPLPMGALALISLAVATITDTVTLEQALWGYSKHVVWLVFIAFLIARGFIKTGLGARIAYYFVAILGRTTIGLSYGLIATELLLAPVVPSNTARGAGILFPIVNSLNNEYDSSPELGTERKIGAYLIKLCFQANIITSTMFLTAMAANPLIASLAGKLGIEITWLSWAKAAIVPGLVALILLPWILMWLYPPQLRKTPEAPELARKNLQKMGKPSQHEWVMILTFGLLLGMWIFGGVLGIKATTTAFVGLSVLLFTGVLSWDDVLKEKSAINTFIWLATILMLSHFLTEFGMISWFSSIMQNYVAGLGWPTAFGIVVLVYFYSHYLFGSMTAHITSMYSALFVVAVAAGAPPGLVAMLLAVSSSLCAGLTHYGTGTSPVYFGANFVSTADWWRVGGILSLVNLTIWVVVGGAWWKLIGLW